MKKNSPYILGICLLGCLLNFPSIGTNPLWNRDDSRYAEMGWEMVHTGDWVTPRLYYVPYLEKPVLTTYLVASSIVLFGKNEFGARFWLGVFAIATALGTYFLALRLMDRKRAFVAAFLLLTSVEFFILGQLLTTDMILTFFVTLSYYFSFRYLMDERDGEKEHRPLWGILLAGSLAFTVFTKGFVGLILVLFPFSLYLIFTKQATPLKKFPYFRGFFFFLLILTPWHIAIYQNTPQFFRYFYYRNNIEAFFNKKIHHTAPFYSVFFFLLGGFLPWTLFFLCYLKRKYREFFQKNNPHLLLLTWLGGSFLFFTLSSAKMITYILPLLPLMAILTATLWKEDFLLEKGEKILTLVVFGLLTVGGIVFALVFPFYVVPLKHLPVGRAFFIYSSIAVGLIAFGCGGGGYHIYKNRSRKGLAFFGICFFLALLPLSYSLQFASDIRSSKKLVVTLKKILKKEDKIFIFHDRDYATFFYFGHRIPHIGTLAEIEQGAHWEPNSHYFLPYKIVPTLLKSSGRVFLLMHKKDYEDKFEKWYKNYYIVLKRGAYMCVSNRPISIEGSSPVKVFTTNRKG